MKKHMFFNFYFLLIMFPYNNFSSWIKMVLPLIPNSAQPWRTGFGIDIG